MPATVAHTTVPSTLCSVPSMLTRAVPAPVVAVVSPAADRGGRRRRCRGRRRRWRCLSCRSTNSRTGRRRRSRRRRRLPGTHASPVLLTVVQPAISGGLSGRSIRSSRRSWACVWVNCSSLASVALVSSSAMRMLRTPDDRFGDLPEFPYLARVFRYRRRRRWPTAGGLGAGRATGGGPGAVVAWGTILVVSLSPDDPRSWPRRDIASSVPTWSASAGRTNPPASRTTVTSGTSNGCARSPSTSWTCGG